MLRTLLFTWMLLLTSQIAFTQSPRKLKSLSVYAVSGDKQYKFLDAMLRGAEVVGLGESSHGTEAFFKVKSDMVKYLTKEQKFQYLAFEMDEEVASAINEYIHGKSPSPKETLQKYGLYNSKELLNLFDWMRDYNVAARHKLQVIGFDKSDFWGNPFTRDSLMAENLYAKMQKGAKYILWSHNTHLVKTNNWDITNSGIKSMGQFLDQQFGNKYFFVALHSKEGYYNVIENGTMKAYAFNFEAMPDFFEPTNGTYTSYFLDVRHMRNSNQILGLGNLFSNHREKLELLPVTPGKDFDAVIYLKTTSASVGIE